MVDKCWWFGGRATLGAVELYCGLTLLTYPVRQAGEFSAMTDSQERSRHGRALRPVHVANRCHSIWDRALA